MDLDTAVSWAADRRAGVLITLRADGRAQSSDVTFVDDEGDLLISTTDRRAKTTNIRRDPRVVIHTTEPLSWSYVSIDASAELSPVARAVDDEVCDRLVAYYEAVTGSPHPDWQDYREAMVEEARLLIRVTPRSAVGRITG